MVLFLLNIQFSCTKTDRNSHLTRFEFLFVSVNINIFTAMTQISYRFDGNATTLAPIRANNISDDSRE